MAKKNEYVVQITGDISDLQKKLQEASGDAKRLSDKEVVITLSYDGNIKGFNKEFEKIAKENPELTVQMQYDINKQTLSQEMKKLQTLEDIKIDIDTKKASDKIEAFYDELQQDLYSNKSEKQIKEKITDILKYADAVDRLGGKINRNDIVGNIDDMLDDFDFRGNIDDIIDSFLNLEKVTSHLTFTDNIENEINQTKARIEDFQEYMKSLLSKGAIDSQSGNFGNSIIDEKNLLELSDLLKKISEDVSEIRQSLNSVDDQSGIPDIIESVNSLLQKLNEVHTIASEEGFEIVSEQEIKKQKELEQSIQKTTDKIEEQKRIEKEESIKSDVTDNIKNEADSLNPLKNALLEVIDLIDKKTQGFLDEEVLVKSAVENEATMINTLVGQLGLVRDVLKDISEATKGSHSGLGKGLEELLDIVNREDFRKSKDELYKFKDALKEVYDELSSIKLPEDSFINQLNNLMIDKEALKQMADIAKNAKAVEKATKTKKEKDEKSKGPSDSDVEKLKAQAEAKIADIDNFRKIIENSGKDSEGVKQIIENYKKLKATIQEIADTVDKTNFDKMSKSFKEAKQSFKDYKADFQALEKPIETSKITQEMAQLSQFMQKNSGASKEWLNQLESCYAVLKQLSTQGNVMNSEFEPIKATIREIEAKMRQAGQTGISMWDRIGRSLKSQIAQQAAMYLSLQDFIRYFRTAFTTIKDLDYALVDLRKTTTMSANDLNQFYLDANESAKKYGVTTKEIIDQASSWSRLGFSSKDEATKMAEMSSKFTLISPGMDTQQSMDGLVSTMKAYGIEVADVEKEIMDKVNIIGNTAATSNQEIVDMLTRSSAAMAEANNSLEDTIALETAAVEITRNAETTGTA